MPHYIRACWFFGEPPGGGRESSQTWGLALPECATGEASSPRLSDWAGGGNQNTSGARFAQGMRESVLVTDRNRLYHGGQLLLPKRDEPREGRPAATTPPKSVLPPFGS